MALEFQSGENDRVAEREAKAKRDPGPDKTTRDRHAKILTEARERFALVTTAEKDQRAQELEDLKFARARREDQWEPHILAARGGQAVSGASIPARPCLVINKLGQPVQQVINEAKGSKLSIRIKAKGKGATAKGAHLRQGLIRAIETDSQANVARFWALERAAKCGRGYYRILKEYANDGDWDMDLVVKMIQNQASVYLDPYHKELNGSDAEWAFITDDITRGEYRRRYAESEVAGALTDELGSGGEFLESIGDQPSPWVTDKNVRIAEYFYRTYAKRTLLAIPSPDGAGHALKFEDELAPEERAVVKAAPSVKRRVVDFPTIRWCVINGYEVLDEEEWDGRFIPIVQVLGKCDNVNGERSYKGVITDAKDAQRSYNVQRSAQVEAVGLAPKAPWVLAEGQVEGYEDEWGNANTRNYAFLTYRPTSYEGHLVGPPQRNVAEPALQGISLAVREAEQDIKDTTGRQDASLGKYRSDESGKAIRERKEQGQQSSSNYMDFLATISMPHEARILLDLLPKVYDTPGRMIKLLGDDPKKEEQAILGVPFLPGPDGIPVPAPDGPPPGAEMAPPPGAMAPPMAGPGGPPPGMMPGAPPMGPPPPKPPEPKLYTLDDGGDYAVVVSVSPSVETEKDDNARAIETIMEALGPPGAAAVADLYAQQIEGPMGELMAKRLAKMNPVAAQDDLEDADMPPAAAAKMFALQQQLQQAMQAMQAMQQEIEGEKFKVEADAAMTQATLASRERIAQMQAQVNIQIASGKAMSAQELAEFKAQQDLTMQSLEFAHDRMMALMQARTQAATMDTQAKHATLQNAQQASLKLATTPPAARP